MTVAAPEAGRPSVGQIETFRGELGREFFGTSVIGEYRKTLEGLGAPVVAR